MEFEETYEYAEVEPRGPEDFLLISTDETLFDWLEAEIKAIVPSCLIEGEKYPLGAGCVVVARKLGKKPLTRWDWWVMKRLCQQGWEPLGKASSVSGMGGTIGSRDSYCFRKRLRKSACP